MTNVADTRITCTLREQVNSARRNCDKFLVLGIVQIVAGMLVAGLAFAGGLLLITAGAQVAAALLAHDWGGFFLFLLLGVLDVTVAFLSLRQSLLLAERLNLVVAAAYPIGSVLRIVVAVVEDCSSWRWLRMNGMITMLVGVAIWGPWPESGRWTLGLLIGVDLVVNGTIWSLLAALDGIATRW